MSDIVERMKDYKYAEEADDLLIEAAAEIVRLRATIEQLRAIAGKASIDGGPTFAQIKSGQGTIP